MRKPVLPGMLVVVYAGLVRQVQSPYGKMRARSEGSRVIGCFGQGHTTLLQHGTMSLNDEVEPITSSVSRETVLYGTLRSTLSLNYPPGHSSAQGPLAKALA